MLEMILHGAFASLSLIALTTSTFAQLEFVEIESANCLTFLKQHGALVVGKCILT